MIRTGILAGLLVVPPLLGAQISPQYPGVREEYVPVLLAMKSGEVTDPIQLPWRLYVPENIPSGEKLPLVVCLHGAGSRGTDNMRHIPLFKSFWSPGVQGKHPAFVLFPQMKHAWVRKTGGFTNYSVEETPISPEMVAMLRLVKDTIREHPIDPGRVYVVGMSMGGYGAWDALIREPGLWAAGVPICGGADPSRAASIKDIPVWAWHGSEDTTVPPENSREMVEALRRAGGNPKYSEPKVGHSSWNDAYREPELYEWLFAQRKPAS